MKITTVGAISVTFKQKIILYGPPGVGKTPMAATQTPNPLVWATEPGLSSIQTPNTPLVATFNIKDARDCIKWLMGSNEPKKYDTWIIDSGSELAELMLKDHQDKNRDGRAAYGEMNREVMALVNFLYFLPDRHIVLVAKELIFDVDRPIKRPYFPGRELTVKVTHRFNMVQMDHQGGPKSPVKLRCRSSHNVEARIREQPNIPELIDTIDWSKLFI